jgi:hypothetical protein
MPPPSLLYGALSILHSATEITCHAARIRAAQLALRNLDRDERVGAQTGGVKKTREEREREKKLEDEEAERAIRRPPKIKRTVERRQVVGEQLDGSTFSPNTASDSIAASSISTHTRISSSQNIPASASTLDPPPVSPTKVVSVASGSLSKPAVSAPLFVKYLGLTPI